MNTAEQKRTSPIKLLIKYGVPIAVSVGLCWLLFRDFDFAQMWQTVRTECHFEWIGVMCVITIFSHVFRAMRWQIQLRALNVNAPLFALILSIFGTYAVNLVFPRLGEVWRTGYIANRQQTQFTTVFGSMVADRLADTITVGLLTLATFVLASGSLVSYLAQSQATYDAIMGVLRSPWLWLGGVAMIALAWWIIAGKTSNNFILKIRKVIKELWAGFAVVVTMPSKGRWFVLTVAIWGCYFMQLFVAFFAFDFTTEVVASGGIIAVLVTFVFSSISMGVPSNGGIGPWQWAVIFALGIYGLDSTRAGIFANLVLGCNTLLLILLGLFTFAVIALERRKTDSETNNQIKQ